MTPQVQKFVKFNLEILATALEATTHRHVVSQVLATVPVEIPSEVGKDAKTPEELRAERMFYFLNAHAEDKFPAVDKADKEVRGTGRTYPAARFGCQIDKETIRLGYNLVAAGVR